MKADDYPGLYQDAESVSRRAQTRYLRAVVSSMTLLVSSAVISLFELAPTWASLIQATAILGSIAITFYLAAQRPHFLWARTRVLAETVKSETWRFMMRAEPFACGEVAARTQFISVLSEIIRDDPAIGKVTATSGSDQISAYMMDVRKENTEARKAFYDLERIGDQLDWFRRKVRSNERLAAYCFVGLVLLQCLAIAFALAGFIFPDGPRWPVGILTSAAAATMAWMQAKRFRELAASYSVTAHELSLLRTKLPNITTDEELSSFVAETEAGLSRDLARWRRTRGEN